MAYLSVGSFGEVEIQSASAPQSRVPIGEVQKTFGGELKSTIRGMKKTWGPWDTVPMTLAGADALEAAIGLGNVPCSGDGIGGSFDTYITVAVRDIKSDGMDTGFERILTLTIQQV